MQTMQGDISMRSRDGTQVAVVELKNPRNLTGEAARLYRREMIIHGVLPQTPFFLLLSQDIGYLWKDARPDTPDAPPTVAFSMGNVIERYLTVPPGHRLIRVELEIIVVQWLGDLAAGLELPAEEPDKTLAAVGFIDAIRGASVVPEATA